MVSKPYLITSPCNPIDSGEEYLIEICFASETQTQGLIRFAPKLSSICDFDR